MGLLVALVPGGTARAAESCEEPVTAWLDCWAERVSSRGAWVVKLDRELALDGQEHHERKKTEEAVRKRRHQLVVDVPDGARTGQGGTVLLILAGGRLVHPGASIDRLPKWAVDELDAVGACTPTRLCDMVREEEGDKQPLTGAELIQDRVVTDSSTQLNAFEPIPGPEPSNTPTTSPGDRNDKKDKGDKDDKKQDDKKQDDKGGGTGQTVDNQNGNQNGENDSLFDGPVVWMSLVLALLLLAFVILVRRSRGPVAVGHRAAPVRGGGNAAPTRAVRTANRASPAPAHGGDESTARLRVTPAAAPRHGRHVGARPSHARTAVVRSDLHPQGYVELDRVLYRAVWADPDRPPPAPGGLVDVTDARERDSDVLYAFPPTAARHAKGTPR
ncbi:hypothetical protein SGFS_046230 [Streptomyces graminofaciens]|uniref:Uncharacterized protein n=1 Tax=Streptomyces graminofaciens TaxID=68212 RepID=A0ABN5VJ20_9ACTN|nr:hypothetical protein [Streptomyces graminofaciens]BBC33329.1 hypothetical protein SGFS_046230 [Streptomyces graminofaciens]